MNFSNFDIPEDNLQQLHEIHNSIQRMRDSTLSALAYGSRGGQNENSQRLSSSCPSLCPLGVTDGSGRSGHQGAGSDPDLANCSTNSSPTHFPPVSSHQMPQMVLGVDRRRSWTDIEDSRHNRHRCTVGDHLQAQNMVRPCRLGQIDPDFRKKNNKKISEPKISEES